MEFLINAIGYIITDVIIYGLNKFYKFTKNKLTDLKRLFDKSNNRN